MSKKKQEKKEIEPKSGSKIFPSDEKNMMMEIKEICYRLGAEPEWIIRRLKTIAEKEPTRWRGADIIRATEILLRVQGLMRDTDVVINIPMAVKEIYQKSMEELDKENEILEAEVIEKEKKDVNLRRWAESEDGR